MDSLACNQVSSTGSLLLAQSCTPYIFIKGLLCPLGKIVLGSPSAAGAVACAPQGSVSRCELGGECLHWGISAWAGR